jgi:hypothetical protein
VDGLIYGSSMVTADSPRRKVAVLACLGDFDISIIAVFLFSTFPF